MNFLGARTFFECIIHVLRKKGGAQKNRSEWGSEGGVRRARNFLVNPPPCRGMYLLIAEDLDDVSETVDC